MKYLGWFLLTVYGAAVGILLASSIQSCNHVDVVGTETITGIVTSVDTHMLSQPPSNEIDVTVDHHSLDITKIYKNDITVGGIYTFNVTLTEKGGNSLFQFEDVTSYSEVKAQ